MLHNTILHPMKKLKMPNATISLKSDCIVKRNITIIIKGINLSSFLSIVNDFITPNFLKISMKIIGIMNVVTMTVSRQMLGLKCVIRPNPELINMSIIHVGSNIG